MMLKHKRTKTSCRISIASALLAAYLGAGSANAAQFTWTGGAGTMNIGWAAPANWVNGVTPTSSVNTQVYFSTGNWAAFQNIASSISLNRIEFGPGFTGGITGNAIDVHSAAANPNTFIRNSSDLPKQISSNVSVMSPLLIEANGAGTLTFAGVISGGANIAKTGGGMLRLTGNNTYSGSLSVNAGTVALGA